jgi:hypothetical protein
VVPLFVVSRMGRAVGFVGGSPDAAACRPASWRAIVAYSVGDALSAEWSAKPAAADLIVDAHVRVGVVRGGPRRSAHHHHDHPLPDVRALTEFNVAIERSRVHHTAPE